MASTTASIEHTTGLTAAELDTVVLRVVAIVAGGPGNRNDTVHYRGSRLQAICQYHRRVLADGGYRGVLELRTPVFRKNRIVRDGSWRRHRKRRARVEHSIARLRDWRSFATTADVDVTSTSV